MLQYSRILVSLIFSQIIFVNSELVIIEQELATVAVGASAFYSASYQREYTSHEILHWRLNGTNLAQFTIRPDGTFTVTNEISDSRLFSNAELNAPYYNLTLEITNLQVNDSGILDIYISTPTTSVLQTFEPLNVEACDSNSVEKDSGLNITAIGSHSYNTSIVVECASGFVVGSVTLTCLVDATWMQEGSCDKITTTTTTTTIETTTTTTTASLIPTTSDTTTSGANSTYGEESGGFPQGHTAAIVIGVIFLVLLIIHLSLGVFVGLDVVKTLLSTLIIGGLYVLGSVLSIIGIFMCSFGNPESTADYMNGVEKAGTALGTIGLVIIIAALIKAAVTGGSKDYSAGSQ